MFIFDFYDKKEERKFSKKKIKMRLIYFDETKFSEDNPFFFIGGILLPEEHITALENTLMQIQYNFFSTNKLDTTTELHGHGLAPIFGYPDCVNLRFKIT